MLAGQPLPLHRLPLHRRGHRGGRPWARPVPRSETRMRRACYARSSVVAIVDPCSPCSAPAPAARAQNALVVSVWGGNWKDTVERVIGKAVHRQDRHAGGVRGGRHHRPPRQGARGQGQPAGGPQLHHHPRGAALHLRRALRASSTWPSSPTPRRSPARPSAASSTWARWAYVYTVVYRPDLVKEDITQVVRSLEALAQGQDRHAGLRPLAHHHDRRPDGRRQRGDLAEGRGQAQAAQGVHRGLLLHRRPEPGPHEDGPGAGAGDALGQRLPPPGAGHRGEGGAAGGLSGHRGHRHAWR